MFQELRRKRQRTRTLRQNVVVGADFSSGSNSVVWAPRQLVIGSCVALGSDVRIEVDGRIGDHVLFANSSAVVGRTDHEASEVGQSIREARWVGDYPKDLSLTTTIGSDVWIGYGTIVLSGVTIGDSSVIGAGSIVTKDIPPNSIAVGNPARVIGRRFDESDYVDHWLRLESRGIMRIVLTAD